MTKRSFFAASFFGIGLLFGALAVSQWERQTWVPVEAKVVRSWYRTLHKPPLETKHGSIPPRDSRIPMVDYSYQVDGRTYSGTAAVGSDDLTTVYYDPDHPERSREDKPKTFALFLALALAAVFFLAGLRVWLGGPSGRKSPRAEPA